MNAKTNNRIKIFINEAKYALKRLRNNSENSEIRQLEDNDRHTFRRVSMPSSLNIRKSIALRRFGRMNLIQIARLLPLTCW